MKTLTFAIIGILVASSIIASQCVFAQQTAKEILQERDNAKKTGLVYNGTILIATQETNKTEYKAGEKFSVIPNLVNVGNNVATITHGEPLFEIKVLDQNGNTSFIWPDATATIGIDETLKPGMSTTGRWASGYGGFPEIVLDRSGNYTVYSMANINSEGTPAHMESIWSQPLKIVILPANYTSQINSSNQIPPIPYSILRSASPTLTPSENQTVVGIALSVPGLQSWSHDWQYVSTGFLGNNKLATVGFEWEYAMVDLKAPSSSAPVPCDQGWQAEVTVDMTTMKVVSADYPTMESHNCDNYTIGGGPGTSEIPPMIKSPLKQFESGIAAKDVTCKEGLQLVIKSGDDSPACVKPDNAYILIYRGWAKEFVQSVTLTNQSTCEGTPVPTGDFRKNIFPVLIMSPNSTAMVCVTYNFESDWQSYPNKEIYPHGILETCCFVHPGWYSNPVSSNKFEILANPPLFNVTGVTNGSKISVTYKIYAKSDSKGSYDTSVPFDECLSYPLAVGYDSSEVDATKFHADFAIPCYNTIDNVDSVKIISGMTYKKVQFP